MCRTCRRLHDMVADPHVHRVRPLGPQDRPTPSVGTELKKCLVHPDQPLVFHCRKCDVSICLHCKLTSHEGHVTEDLAAAARRAKEELVGMVDKANQQVILQGLSVCVDLQTFLLGMLTESTLTFSFHHFRFVNSHTANTTILDWCH